MSNKTWGNIILLTKNRHNKTILSELKKFQETISNFSRQKNTNYDICNSCVFEYYCDEEIDRKCVSCLKHDELGIYVPLHKSHHFSIFSQFHPELNYNRFLCETLNDNKSVLDNYPNNRERILNELKCYCIECTNNICENFDGTLNIL